jgi:hypothetical protein
MIITTWILYLLRQRRFRILLLIALMILYTIWIVATISRDVTYDFYVYYLAAAAFDQGISAYNIDIDTWNTFSISRNVGRWSAAQYR